MRKLLVELDLAGAEWVITAHLSADPAMMQVFRNGQDPHVATACFMFDATADEVREDERLHEGSQDTLRQRGKRSNHSLNYGLGYKQYALRYGMPEPEGLRLRTLYHTKAYPRVSGGLWKRGARAQPEDGYWPWVQDQVRRTGRLVDCFGECRDFYTTPGEELWLDAYAHLPQSTVAGIIRLGMAHVYRDERHAELIAQDHDSITAQVPCAPEYIRGFAERTIGALSPTLCYSGIEFTLGVDAKVGYCRNKLRMVKLSKFLEDPECLSE